MPPDRKPTVLHLCSGNLFGGIERFLVALAESEAMNWRTRQGFIVTSHGRLESELRDRGALVEYVGEVRLRNPVAVVRTRRRVGDFIRRFTPDVVIAHDTWPLVVMGPAVRSRPLVFYQHMRASGSLLERLLPRRLVTAVFCTSAFVAESAGALFPGVPASVVRCTVSAPRRYDRERIRHQLGLRSDEVAIIQVSRFEEYKGHLLLAEALKLLRTRTSWRAILVGGGSRPSERALTEKLERFVGELDGRLVLLGERSDVQELLQASDVFCQPNVAPEAFGLVFVEAMYAGLPVISTDMGGAREAVDSTVGILVPPQASEVAWALSKLIDDPEARKRLGSNGPGRAHAICGETTTVAALVQSIRNVLRTSHRSPGQGPGRAQAPPGQ